MTSEPRNEAAIARQALQDGDLRHAAEHVARGLAVSVEDSELLGLFDEVFDRSEDPLNDVYPLAQETSAADAAAHARALARSGRHDDAYLLLCQIAQVSPAPFLLWSKTWPIPSPEVRTAAITRLWDSGLPQPMRAAHASFVRRTVDAHPDDGQLLAYASVVARRGGDIATAVDWARRAVAIDDSFLALNALARSSVMADDWVGACTAWQQAIANDPTNALLWLDWADATLDRREFDDASERYWQALACDPENDWAQGSLAYIQYLQTPSARAWSELRSWSLANPTNQRGTRVLQMSTPGAGWLPNPIEAMYNGWTQMRANNADLSGANITLSHLEGPSVLHAIRTHVTDFGHRFEEIQTPDPRTPLFEGAVSLWTWDDQTPSPALPPANENIQLLVQELAVQRFDAWAWLDHAKQRAANLGVDDVQQLLACAVHPTTAPEPFDALTWFWRVQHAVAYLLAGYPIAMPESPSIQGLDAMLAVRNDWNAMAALSAMVTLGESVPDIRMHAWGRCYQILQAYPQGGDFLIGDNAYWGLLRLDPNDEAGLANQACAWIDKT